MGENESFKKYEYAVLVTSLSEGLMECAQLYRDRADAENCFDEMKNQWGWHGYTTRDLARCQIMARINALVYNWWSLFVRMGIPTRHAEATTSRPLLLSAVATETRHSGKTILSITSMHGKFQKARQILSSISEFLCKVKKTTEQLSRDERWLMILNHIFRFFLNGKSLGQPQILVNTS